MVLFKFGERVKICQATKLKSLPNKSHNLYSNCKGNFVSDIKEILRIDNIAAYDYTSIILRMSYNSRILLTKILKNYASIIGSGLIPVHGWSIDHK